MSFGSFKTVALLGQLVYKQGAACFEHVSGTSERNSSLSKSYVID